jgi:hypothetical protein
MRFGSLNVASLIGALTGMLAFAEPALAQRFGRNFVTGALLQTWVCSGYSLSNPMERRVCGYGPSESAARSQCGWDLTNISCTHM